MKQKTGKQRGFSLLEMMMVIVILTVVIGIVMKGLVDMQRVNMDQSARVDLTQEARQFLDQISLDLHQSGYPGARLFDSASPPCPNMNTVPCARIAHGMLPPAPGNPTFPVENGVEHVSLTQLQFEGDIDGSGQVSEVYIDLIDAAGNPAAACSVAAPCSLRRGVIPKAMAMAGAAPTYYTQLNGVMNTNIFEARDSAGNIIPLPAIDPNDLGNIRAIDITVQVQSSVPTFQGQFPLITLVSGAKINSVLN